MAWTAWAAAYDMKIGLNIRSVRKRRGLTLDELSKLCGIGRDELGGYERGQTTPRPKTVRRIAAALDIPVTLIRDGMGWTDPRAMEGWETARGASLLRDGILANLKESFGYTDADGDGNGLELEEGDILALIDVVKASVPALVEHMKDTRPENQITCEILNRLDVVQEDSEEELIQKYALTDEQWEQIRPLLPPENGGKGRPFKSNRLMLDGMLFRMKSGAAWSSLPAHFGRYKCVTDRLRLWCRTGVWQSVLNKMRDMKIVDSGFTAAELLSGE